MHFALRGYLFIALTALLGVAGTWSDVPAFAGAWLLPAFLLLLGLAFEAWYLRGTRVTLRMRVDERLKLGRPRRGAFAFRAQPRPRTRAAVRPRAAAGAAPDHRGAARGAAARRRTARSRRICCRCDSAPAGSATVPARLLGRFALAWWTRDLPQDAPFTVAPDSLPGGARPVRR